MKIKLLSFVSLLAVLFNFSCGSKSINVYSPDNDICVLVSDSVLDVQYNHKTVQIIKTGYDKWSAQSRSQTHQNTYKMISGKRSDCSYSDHEMFYHGTDGKKLTVLVTDDGVAFTFNDTKEEICYLIPEGTRRWIQQLKTDYEGFYPESTTDSNGSVLRLTMLWKAMTSALAQTIGSLASCGAPPWLALPCTQMLKL